MAQEESMRIIGGISIMEQRGITLYTFSLPAKRLLEMGIVERFGQSDNGVNRNLNYEHAMGIAEAMSTNAPHAPWTEPFIVALSGGWEYDRRKNQLTGPDTAFLSIDDGQHRLEALKALKADELAGLNFPITAHLNLDFEMRLRMFRRQGMRRQLDARLNLAQRHRLGEWDKPTHAEAYALVLFVNESDQSPLKGLIQLQEGEKRAREDHGGTTSGINAQGLFSTFCTLIGNKSPLSDLSAEDRKRVLVSTLRVASEIWPDQWRSKRHILTTARGITAILQLFITGTNFRAEIGSDFSEDAVRRGLVLGMTFDWAIRRFKNVSWRDIAERLDQSIQRGSRGRRGELKAVSAS